MRALKTLSLCLLTVVPVLTNAQAPPAPDTVQGESPFATYTVSDIDQINPINGNLYLNIPLLSYPQRGHALRLNFRVFYNDKGWFIKNNIPIAQAGTYPYSAVWAFSPNSSDSAAQAAMGAYVARDQHLDWGKYDNISSYSSGESYDGYTVTSDVYSVFVRESNGAQHFIGDGENQSCTSQGSGICPGGLTLFPSELYAANDGSGFIASPGQTIASEVNSVLGPDGVTYTANSVSDTLGNQINVSANGWTDSVGRQIPGSSAGPGTATGYDPADGYTVAEPIPGVPTPVGQTLCPAGTASARAWQAPGYEGGSATYYLCYSNFSYQTNFNLDSEFGTTYYKPVYEASGTVQLLSAIVLPNQMEYTFSYDSYLSLRQLTLPTGAIVQYTWQNVPFLPITDPTRPVSRALATRTVLPGNGQASRTWRYTWYPNWTLQQGYFPEQNYPYYSVVTDPLGNDTEYTIGGSVLTNAIMSAKAVYRGCSPHDNGQSGCTTAGASMLRGESYSYVPAAPSNQPTPYNTPAYQSGLYLNQLTTTTITLPSGITTQVVNTPAPRYGTCSVETYGSGTQPISTATVQSCHVYNQNVANATYDYGSGSPGPLLSSNTTTYVWSSSASNATAYSNANLLDLPASTITTDGSASRAAEMDYYYDEDNGSPQGAYGNLTTTTRWNNLGTSPSTHGVYDANGELITAIDALGNQTTVTYQCSDSVPSLITNPLGQPTQYGYDCATGLLVQVQNPNDLKNGRSGTQYVYDQMRNLTTITRPDGGSTSTNYGNYQFPLTVTQTITATPDPSIVRSTVYDGLLKPLHQTNPDGSTSETTYDLLGRVQSTTNPHFGTALSTDGTTTFAYDALGRMVTQTLPDQSTLQWCYDGLSNSGQPTCPANSSTKTGTWVTDWDEAGVQKQNISDGLGRLEAVMEPNPASGTLALESDYGYNATGDLTSVAQKGNSGASETPRTRSFAYDSLSRLITAINPENGTLCFGTWSGGSVGSGACQNGYDGNGNPLYKTDANNVVTSYTYDALNRLTWRRYSDGTLSQAIAYDGLAENGQPNGEFPTTNAIGYVSHTSTQVNSASTYEYDVMGRLIAKADCNPDDCGYNDLQTISYDLAGHITGIKYPDGRTITQSIDGAGRVYQVTDTTPGNAVTYWTANSFWPDGVVHASTLGNGVTLDTELNNRLQVTASSANSSAIAAVPGHANNVYDKSIAYAAPNNGNISSIVDNLYSAQTQNFQYDGLNRLYAAARTDNGYNHKYIYDSFGNMLLQDNVNGNLGTYCINAATNRLFLNTSDAQCTQNSNLIYDAAGHLTADPVRSYTYTAEELLHSIGGATTASYTYNEGMRTGKTSSAGWTDYIYLNGQVLAEQDSTGMETDYIYANGQKIAKATDASYFPASTDFYVADQLGTTQVELSGTGTILYQGAFTPFGQEIVNGQTNDSFVPTTDGFSTHYKFTGKERDQESGLDYFGARYYGSLMGRFMSPDHPFVDQHPENPQSWNLYAYARNNPLILLDPTGLGCVTDLGQGSDKSHEKVELNNSISSDECAGQHGTWVPGDINKDDIGAYRSSNGDINFQVTTNTGGNVYYSSFVSGAQTDQNGIGAGASIAHASTDWLSSQLVGGSLGQMMSFAARRMAPRTGGALMALLAGPGFSLDAPDNWAGPGGMGTPQGQGDWAAMVHDYNFATNHIYISTYFNPFVSRATAKALIQSDNNLIGHAGGAQAVKMGMFFGVVNSFQWLTHAF